MSAPLLAGSIHIVGTGLIGASLGLALTAEGHDVTLEDASPAALHLARDLGAGSIGAKDPSLVVVATPPDVIVPTVLDALKRFPNSLVTDVASAKARIEAQILASTPDAAVRYMGSHPMAGKEKSGAAAADGDIFAGRTWVICSRDGADPSFVSVLKALATAVGSIPVVMTATEHDAAVAAVSHLPQLMASLTAARLDGLSSQALSLAGQGLRDTTRIAASDPMLWSQIFTTNAAALAPLARTVLTHLSDVVDALERSAEDGQGADGVMSTYARLIESGRTGVSRIPGKHGGAARRYAEVTVLVPDTAGQLGKLFTDVGDAGVNIEDFRMEHSAGAKLGVATLFVAPSRATELVSFLDDRDWRVL